MGMSSKAYRPWSSVFVVCVADVSLFLMETVAPGTAALEASVTRPDTDAVATCP
jgi:hypothetical protein